MRENDDWVFEEYVERPDLRAIDIDPGLDNPPVEVDPVTGDPVTPPPPPAAPATPPPPPPPPSTIF